MYSSYFQAYISVPQTWFFVATFRAHEHLAFDRTLDKTTGLFEFFVPQDQAAFFKELMHEYQSMGLVVSFQELPNRLLDPREVL